MTTALKLRRGTTSQHSTFTGADGEVTVDTTKKTVVVHDGATAGGFPLVRNGASDNVGVGTSDFTYGKVAVNGSIVNNYSGASKYAWANSGAYYNWIESGGTAGAAYMRFAVADTERMRIDSNGNVGIGTVPSAWNGFTALQLPGGNAFYSNGGQASIGSNAYNNAGWKYAGTGTAGLATAVGGSFTWYGAESGTAGNTISSLAQILQFAKGYTVALQGASAVVGTGITFPASQNASSDANTLDDYEEGTFTPVLRGSTTAGTVTYATDGRVGRYTKIGNTCKFQIWIQWSNWTGAVGSVQVAGLPFTSKGTPSNYTAVNVYMDSPYTLTAGSVIQGYVNQNVNYVFLSQYATGGGGAADLGFDTSSALMISGTYETD